MIFRLLAGQVQSPEIRQHLFNCLLHALAMRGEAERVDKLLREHASSSQQHTFTTANGISTVSDAFIAPYFCAAMGYAAMGDVGRVMRLLHSLPSSLDEKKMARHAIDVYFTLLSAAGVDTVLDEVSKRV